MYNQFTKELLKFIEHCPSSFHAINSIEKELIENGFKSLSENKKWILQTGKKYYVTRNQSSIIAFKIGNNLDDFNFNIIASHSDSPTFKIKENYKLNVDKKYVKLNTEKYGGMIFSSWMDRPLSVAGRVIIKTENSIETKLVNVDKDLVLIPNVAIHMNKEINTGMKYNEQVDLIPLFGTYEKNENEEDNFLELIAKLAKTKKENILSHDLFLYNRMKPSVWGSNGEFISSPKLDDLQCAFTSLKAFLSGSNTKSINLFCCFDNEEVGSGTKQGAASTFLKHTLERLSENLGKTKEEYLCALSTSFMLSADNAHAVHPNHPELSDPTNKVYMNEGVVIKYNANQKYTTDGVSSSLVKHYCNAGKIPYQSYINRSDIAGGSTLGNIASSQVSIKMADIGIAQLAMHSSYETAGNKDTYYMFKLMEEFYNSHIEETDGGTFTISK
ncbi:MAG: family aminopeptidase [Bacillota bacterium]|jgi:aspartyl aminopeptidase|nr:family aminopeptidase [Bacillota bacterium]